MKANDFRIGNMVSYYHPAVEGLEPLIGHVINKAEDDIIIAEYQHASLRTYSIGGIFLTDRWLKELGFRPLKGRGNVYSLNKIELVGDSENKKFYFIDGFKYAKNIKYLHQLQNLYFEIHNDELSLIADTKAIAS